MIENAPQCRITKNLTDAVHASDRDILSLGALGNPIFQLGDDFAHFQRVHANTYDLVPRTMGERFYSRCDEVHKEFVPGAQKKPAAMHSLNAGRCLRNTP